MSRGRYKSNVKALINIAMILFLVFTANSASISTLPVFTDETTHVCGSDPSNSDLSPDLLYLGDLSVVIAGFLQNINYAGDKVFRFVNSRSRLYCLLITDLPPPNTA